ncbi:hypothetical protein AB1L42_07970 [Thalassoglobus sp. JC818]|uniref:hypothetical protein n=1 Tax=Thalassoglobus sp. JC818 TaxID=3232136 RepID=UPI00345AE423
MSAMKSAAVFLLCMAWAGISLAEHFTYGDDVVAGVHDEQFSGKHCRISVYGPTGGSYVSGTYQDPNGELRISVDRYSYLEVRGSARKVVVTFIDRNSNVNLEHLKVGTGGIEIHSVNRRSKVDIGESLGHVTLKSVEASSISVPHGTHVIGEDRMRDGARLFFEGRTTQAYVDE